MSQAIVTVTKKAQATIPRRMRNRHKIGRKALVLDTERGVLVMPIPDLSMDKGSLKALLKGKTSKEIMNEIRREEIRHEAKRGGRRSR